MPYAQDVGSLKYAIQRRIPQSHPSFFISLFGLTFADFEFSLDDFNEFPASHQSSSMDLTGLRAPPHAPYYTHFL
jgi:hypothetical protein